MLKNNMQYRQNYTLVVNKTEISKTEKFADYSTAIIIGLAFAALLVWQLSK